MKKLFLFDMDGTLTPARCKMSWKVQSELTRLQRSGWDIGIISGSDLDYIKQQCDVLLDMSPFDVSSTHFLPCNGTKYYKNFKKIWEYNMRSKLGSEFMTKLFKTLLGFQNTIVSMQLDIPLTGNFFQMRGSVLNWCPIGRNAIQSDRELWTIIDKEYAIRKLFIDQFEAVYDSSEITIKMGGETSFDIYPAGWDKTFPIDKKPFIDYEKIYFAGDRCFKNGNDKELYDLLIKKDKFNAFCVNNPCDTINIINKVIEEGSI